MPLIFKFLANAIEPSNCFELAQSAAEKFEKVAVAANLESKVEEEFLYSREMHPLLAIATDDSRSELSLPGEAAEKYFLILVTNQHLSSLLGDMKKPTGPKNYERTAPTAKKSEVS
jgi:hypothetical protein